MQAEAAAGSSPFDEYFGGCLCLKHTLTEVGRDAEASSTAGCSSGG